MEPHVFCGPEFVLEIPTKSVHDVLIEEEQPVTSGAAVTPSSTEEKPIQSTTTITTSARGWAVRLEALLRLQTELYGVCTPQLRRRLRPVTTATASVGPSSSSSTPIASSPTALGGSRGRSAMAGPIPEPPAQIEFLEARPTSALTSEEVASIAQSCKVAGVVATDAPETTPAPVSSEGSPSSLCSPSAPRRSHVYVVLLVTDSRVAAELYLVGLRNKCVALPYGCRLLNYYRVTARSTPIVPLDILGKRETLRRHLNLDADLWSALETAVTDELVQQVEKDGGGGQPYAGGRLLTAAEQHQSKVTALLRYCEQHVQYAGVLDNQEEASPFLIAFGLFHRLELTSDDLLAHFARHPRRVLRVLALFLARYLLPPEELEAFFFPSIEDSVVISCTEDLQVTRSVRDICRDLLLKDEVNEAWLPAYHKFWLERVVGPLVQRMEQTWRRQEEARAQRRLARSTGGDVPDEEEDAEDGTVSAATATATTATTASALAATTGDDGRSTALVEHQLQGSGRGVAGALGFHRLQDVLAYVKQQERTLVPERMATLLSRNRRRRRDDGGGGEGVGDDWSADSGDDLDQDEGGSDDDDFLIHVVLAGSEGAGGVARTQRRPRGEEGSSGGGGGVEATASPAKRTNRSYEKLDARQMALKEGHKLTLALLGRTRAFSEDDPLYLEF